MPSGRHSQRHPHSGLSVWRWGALACWLLAACAQGAPAMTGGTGLNYMRTADVMGGGEVELSLFGIIDSYVLPGTTNRGLDLITEPGIAFGLLDTLEIGFSTPYLMNFPANNDTIHTGIRHLAFFTKFRLAGHRGGFGSNALAFTLFGASWSGTEDVGLRSGDPNFGFEMNWSLYDDLSSFHISVGEEQADEKVITDPALSYAAESKYSIRLGWETHPDSRIHFSIESNLSRYPSNGDDDLHIIPGFKYYPNSSTVYNFALFYGMPDGVARPTVRFIAGMAYTFNAPPRRTRLDRVVAKLNRVEQAVATMAHGDLSAKRQADVGVMVIDGMEKRVSEYLLQRGYKKLLVKQRAENRPKQTVVYYRLGLSREAQDLARLLPKAQIRQSNGKLPKGIDLLVVAGEQL